MTLSEDAKLLIAETVREEVHKLLDRGSEIMTTNDRLWLMRNEAHRETDLLRERLDRANVETKLDQAALRQVRDYLETWWPQLTKTEYGQRVRTIAPVAEILVECYEAVCKRIRILPGFEEVTRDV